VLPLCNLVMAAAFPITAVSARELLGVIGLKELLLAVHRLELDVGVGDISFVCFFVLVDFFKNAFGFGLELCNLERCLGNFVFD